MLRSEELSRQINSEDEALVVLGALGFTISHWPFIKKVGGAQQILPTDFLDKMLQTSAKCKTFLDQMSDLRAGLDDFYAGGGFLVSPHSHPQSRLFKASSAPLVFFGRGNQSLLKQTPAVAIVGSRTADLDALRHTKKLSEVLAQHGISVISGGAMGVDTAAHVGACEAQGVTTIISGVRCDFRRAELPVELAGIGPDQLLVLHPFGPFFPQKNYMFVTRNEFVASLCDQLVVVQGLAKSGTLHTAKYAGALNIPIFAIPGAIHNPKSYVPNHLLEQGLARPLVDFERFACTLVPLEPERSETIKKTPAKLSKEELPYLLNLIRKHDNALTMDEIMALSGKSFGECQVELLDYELAGKIFKRGAQFVLSAQ